MTSKTIRLAWSSVCFQLFTQTILVVIPYDRPLNPVLLLITERVFVCRCFCWMRLLLPTLEGSPCHLCWCCPWLHHIQA
jgi:hypothetical protein